MKQLTIFDIVKLIVLNIIVASIIALACVGFVYADGVDDPNFYRDFNPNNPHPKYEFFAPPEWRQHQQYNVQPIPSGSHYWRRIANIPEPTELLLLSTGMVGLCAWRRFK